MYLLMLALRHMEQLLTSVKTLIPPCIGYVENKSSLLKTISLPRLELMATVLATRFATFILSSIKCQCNVHLWSDSQIVLYWINSHKKLKPFVNARIREITSTFPAANWHYCPTSDNPADLLTRGITLLNNWPYPPDGNMDQHGLPPRHCGLHGILQMLFHHNPQILPVH